MTPSFAIVTGEAAVAWARDPANRARWLHLAKRCPWATAFLGSDFFDVWTRHYGTRWKPVIAWSERPGGDLIALMPLAIRDGIATGIGAHQAEYHGWLSEEVDALSALRGCIGAIRAQFADCEIRLQYLHAETPRHAVDEFCAYEPRAVAERFQRHRLKLDAKSIGDVLRKKGNKSKINRLGRLGRLELKRLDADAFVAHLEETAALCDFRQGAVNNSCPFADDPDKRAFHADMLRDLAEETHASGLFLNGRMISTILFIVSEGEAHVAILAHAPDHASNSPNKIHFYQAALMLAADGLSYVDMTPGGDDWKARFGTESDLVTKLTIHQSPARAAKVKVRTGLVGAARSAASWIGASPSDVKRLLLGEQQRTLAPDLSERSWGRVRVASPTATARREANVRVNDLARLLSDGPRITGLRRQQFLADALVRMEEGQLCYCAYGERALDGLGWAHCDAPERMGGGPIPLLLRLFGFRVATGENESETYERIVLRALRDAFAQTTLLDVPVEFDPNDEALHRALMKLGAIPA